VCAKITKSTAMAIFNFNSKKTMTISISKTSSNKKSIIITIEIFDETLKLKLIFEIAFEIDLLHLQL